MEGNARAMGLTRESGPDAATDGFVRRALELLPAGMEDVSRFPI
jgi:hypothetical protein